MPHDRDEDGGQLGQREAHQPHELAVLRVVRQGGDIGKKHDLHAAQNGERIRDLVVGGGRWEVSGGRWWVVSGGRLVVGGGW